MDRYLLMVMLPRCIHTQIVSDHVRDSGRNTSHAT